MNISVPHGSPAYSPQWIVWARHTSILARGQITDLLDAIELPVEAASLFQGFATVCYRSQPMTRFYPALPTGCHYHRLDDVLSTRVLAVSHHAMYIKRSSASTPTHRGRG